MPDHESTYTPRLTGLVCNYLERPLGVETPTPRLGWRWEAKNAPRGLRQSAYRILVASSPERLNADEGDLWDSGLVDSHIWVQVPYMGVTLVSCQTCFWKVMGWDQDGNPTPWSAPSVWEMGILSADGWQGQWIGTGAAKWSEDTCPPAPYVRRTMCAKTTIASARAYICGLGYYELSINGRRVGDDVLAPPFTRYDRRVLYRTLDVTEYLQTGENVLGVILGNGWYNSSVQDFWGFNKAPWRDGPKLLLQLHIRYADGSEEMVCSDGEWNVASGPIVCSALRNGETYDARLELPGWDTPGFDDAGWDTVQIVPAPGGALHSQQMPPMRVTETLTPVSVREIRPGVFVFDMGRTIAGWAQLRVSGPAGVEIKLRYAEKIDAQGELDMHPICETTKSGEFQTDRYILKGEGEEVWEPRFVYHGFQYVEVTGFPGTPTLESLRGRTVHTDLPQRGEFSCSNELLNTIQTLCLRSTLYTYHGLPTDCPQREKLGWTGDAHLSAEQVLYNFAPMAAYAKWMADFRDAQRENGQLPAIVPTNGWGFMWGNGPAWDSTIMLIPWYQYLYSGDIALLEEMYESMLLYVNYMESMSESHLCEFRETSLGDWAPPHVGLEEYSCPKLLTNSAYYYVDTRIMAKVAAVLGKDEDAARLRARAAKIRMAVRERFVDGTAGTVESGCQTALACALYQGLIDEAELPRVMEAFVNTVEEKGRHLDCGILGTKYLLHALSDNGRTDLAYAVATQTTYPSWGHWIEQGATTLWENWEGNLSRNHHMFSDISAWFYRTLAGLRPDPEAPGFRHFYVKPHPVGGLRHVRARHESLQGEIVCHWTHDAGRFVLELSVPPNTSATVLLPTDAPDDVREGDVPVAQADGVELAGVADGRLVLHLGAGGYRFVSALG